MDFQDFSPKAAIPAAVSLSAYLGGAQDLMRTPLQDLVQQIEKGTLGPLIGPIFGLDQIVEAYRCMEKTVLGKKSWYSLKLLLISELGA
jgi:hypothetical protein